MRAIFFFFFCLDKCLVSVWRRCLACCRVSVSVHWNLTQPGYLKRPQPKVYKYHDTFLKLKRSFLPFQPPPSPPLPRHVQTRAWGPASNHQQELCNSQPSARRRGALLPGWGTHPEFWTKPDIQHCMFFSQQFTFLETNVLKHSQRWVYIFIRMMTSDLKVIKQWNVSHNAHSI